MTESKWEVQTAKEWDECGNESLIYAVVNHQCEVQGYFMCYGEDEANWLCDQLNQLPELRRKVQIFDDMSYQDW